MKTLFTILQLIYTAVSLGQTSNKSFDIKDIISGIRVMDSISWNEIRIGYVQGYGGGNTLYFDSDKTFREKRETCMAWPVIDSGTWEIENNKVLLISSKKKYIRYQILKLDSFSFFVSPSQKHQFTQDLKNLLIKFRNTKPYLINSVKFTPVTLACLNLRRKYYGQWSQIK